MEAEEMDRQVEHSAVAKQQKFAYTAPKRVLDEIAKESHHADPFEVGSISCFRLYSTCFTHEVFVVASASSSYLLLSLFRLNEA